MTHTSSVQRQNVSCQRSCMCCSQLVVVYLSLSLDLLKRLFHASTGFAHPHSTQNSCCVSPHKSQYTAVQLMPFRCKDVTVRVKLQDESAACRRTSRPRKSTTGGADGHVITSRAYSEVGRRGGGGQGEKQARTQLAVYHGQCLSGSWEEPSSDARTDVGR